MSGVTPTRAAVLELQEEQRAMHEGHLFLDEKCLLLAGEMLRQLGQHAELQRSFDAAQRDAANALQAALARHGLQGLQVQPPALHDGGRLQCEARSLMGVPLQDAAWLGGGRPAPPSVHASPEVRDCRRAFERLIAAAAPLAAVCGNLERLSQEYRRSLRRARALQDVLMPELVREIDGIQTRLEELEQEDALTMRRRH
jgi:V/A-type H+-transporting ATPase subunit D